MYLSALRVNIHYIAYSSLFWILQVVSSLRIIIIRPILINNGTRYFKLNNKQIVILIRTPPQKKLQYLKAIFLCVILD